MPKQLSRVARNAVMVVGLLVIAGSTVGGIALAAERSGNPAPVSPAVSPSGDDHGRAGANDSDRDQDGQKGTPATSATCKPDDDSHEDGDHHGAVGATPSAHGDDATSAHGDDATSAGESHDGTGHDNDCDND